jgi:hypothetical protein
MKVWIYKTLGGKSFSTTFKGNNYLKFTENRQVVKEYKNSEAIEGDPEVELCGTKIHVGFKTYLGLFHYPIIEENGVMLYGSKNGSGPDYALSEAFGIGIFIALANLIFGIFLLTVYSSLANKFGSPLEFLIFGLVFLVLSIGIKYKNIKALYAYIILLSAHLLLYVLISILAGDVNVFFIILRVAFIFSMVKAVPAMQIVQSQKKYQGDDILDSPIN